MRAAGAGDLDALVALNDAHAREVNALGVEGMTRAIAGAAWTGVVDADDGGIGAFLVAFDETTPAQGPNHAWFLTREARFRYVDRVVVAANARGRGVARALYDALAATGDGRPLCCEVNLEPPNPASLAFHERLGFARVGEGVDPRNGKRVVYLRRG